MTRRFVESEESKAHEKEKYNVFVYGTLMRGERAHSFLSGAKYLGEFCLKDFAMYNLGWFPGIRPSSGDTVFGEVYQVDSDMIQRMDHYEGEGTLYRRTSVVVESKAGNLAALVYVYAHEIYGDKIEGGKWNERE